MLELNLQSPSQVAGGITDFLSKPLGDFSTIDFGGNIIIPCEICYRLSEGEILKKVFNKVIFYQEGDESEKRKTYLVCERGPTIHMNWMREDACKNHGIKNPISSVERVRPEKGEHGIFYWMSLYAKGLFSKI